MHFSALTRISQMILSTVLTEGHQAVPDRSTATMIYPTTRARTMSILQRVSFDIDPNVTELDLNAKRRWLQR